MHDDVYTHVHHISRQKGTKVSGIPLLSTLQIVGTVGGLGLVAVLEAHWTMFILFPLIAIVLLQVVQNDYVYMHIFTLAKSAIFIRINQPATVNIAKQWDLLADASRRSGKAAVVYRSKGTKVVAGIDE